MSSPRTPNVGARGDAIEYRLGDYVRGSDDVLRCAPAAVRVRTASGHVHERSRER